MKKLGAIGECMLELRQDGKTFELGYGGDVFNTAVYAARSGASVFFLTATGEDSYSNYLIDAWQSHGIDTSLVRRFADATPALYAINLDEHGERSFTYWRDATPVKRWLDPGDYVGQLENKLDQFDCLYFSGITLAILDETGRKKLLEMVTTFRQQLGLVAFDTNYRSKLWPDRENAIQWFDKAYAACDIALPSIDDEQALRGESLSAAQLLDHIGGLGCKEIVIKQGANGTRVRHNGTDQTFSVEPVTPVDTTAAGDAFNGAYLASRLSIGSVSSSVARGAEMARQVIQKPGAIVETA